MKSRRLAPLGVIGTIALSLFAAGQLAAASPRKDQLPPEKQAMEQRIERDQAQAAPANKATDNGGPLILQTDAPPVVGLGGAIDAPISGSEFIPSGAWAGWTKGGDYVQVWVGARPDEQDRGLLFVLRHVGNGNAIARDQMPTGRLIPVPIPGPLSISSVDRDELVIRNPAGTETRFSPEAGTFQ
ncbi:MAG: hypothetical protein ACOYXS_05855 [Chloroflexota bacterium]